MANAQVPDPNKNNADVARKQADQDISGKPTVTGEFGDASDALDALAAKVAAKPEGDVQPDVQPKPDAKPDAAPKPDATPKPEDDAVAKRAEELFKDAPKLPPNASPKSSEAFSAIKQKAAQEISQREQEIEKLRKEIEAAKNPSPEQLAKEKELEDHRTWRAKIDVDFDPKFKEFDKSIEQHREFIYAQLQKNPKVTPEVIAQIKKYGGPDSINLTKLFESIQDPTLQRLVEAKVADIEQTKYNKDQAIQSAKENLTQYVKERQEVTARETQERVKAVTGRASELLGKLDWFSEKPVDPKADETVKKEVTEHNKFVSELKGQISAALQDDSPEMRAILVTGMAQLFHLQRVMPGLKARAEKAEKELSEVTAKWEAVKHSSRSRLQESAAPAAGLPPAKPTDNNVNVPASQALDEIAKQVMEKRSQAAAGQ